MSTSTATARPAVKNLRAMFENKSNDQSTSPPSRGRSPNGSVSSQASRQVSKVRTSFVSVERPGDTTQSPQWAIRKTSDVSSMAEVREEAILEDNNRSANKPTAQYNPTPTMDLGAILKGSPFENPALPIKSTSNESIATQPATKPRPTRTGSTQKVAALVGNIQSAGPPLNVDSSSEAKTPKPAPSPTVLNIRTGIPKAKESPTMTKKSPTAQKKDSPVIINGNGPGIKPRGGVNKIIGVMQSSNKAKEERVKAEQAAYTSVQDEKKKTTIPKDVKNPSAASKPTATAKAHIPKQDRITSGVDQAKSPVSARPAKLPSAATAGTAASAARQGVNADEDGKSGPSERKSTIPHAPRVAAASTRASLAKKSSRVSLANGEDRPRSRISAVHKPADDDFLARMTRPTASSARRAQEKVQTSSPPRVRQPSAGQTLVKKPARKSLSSGVKTTRTTDEANETTLDSSNERSRTYGNTTLEEDEGEPGPAEEEGVLESSQPAEVL